MAEKPKQTAKNTKEKQETSSRRVVWRVSSRRDIDPICLLFLFLYVFLTISQCHRCRVSFDLVSNFFDIVSHSRNGCCRKANYLTMSTRKILIIIIIIVDEADNSSKHLCEALGTTMSLILF